MNCIKVMLIFITLLPKTSTNAQTKQINPSLILQAVCWEKYSSQNIIYFPWGNPDEANATRIQLNVGFSVPTENFVYYGTSPLQLYQENRQNLEAENPNLELVAEFNFDESRGMHSYLLLISKNKKLQVFPLSISQQDLPYGAFNCYSQSKKNLYIAYEDQKQVLAPGKSVRFVKKNEQSSSSELKVYTRIDGKYEQAFTDNISLNDDRRGIVFFSPFRNRLRMKRFYLERHPIETATGYNSVPIKVFILEKTDENVTESE